jgi:hypothetical protein
LPTADQPRSAETHPAREPGADPGCPHALHPESRTIKILYKGRGRSTALLAESGQMDQLVDLGAVTAELHARRAGWEGLGVQVGTFTWRDAQATWSQPIVSDRALVADPESLGMTLEAAPGRYGELVPFILFDQ